MSFSFSAFLGQFHPLLVHLPIGFLLLAGIFFFLGKRSNYHFLHKALPTTLFLTAVSSAGAAIVGWWLANKGGQNGSTLFWHRWLGIGLVFFSILAWRWSLNKNGGTPKRFQWLLLANLGLLTVVGHLGGEMTHGKGYLLKSAPTFVQQFFGNGAQDIDIQNFPNTPDSVKIFAHLVQPILTNKCTNCHNAKNASGKLRLDSYDELMKGGSNGKVVLANQPLESEIFKRIMLPTDHVKFMPTSGIPMTYAETRILAFWIENGLSLDLNITDKSMPEDLKKILEKEYNLSSQPLAFFETTTVLPASIDAIQKLEKVGFRVQNLASENHFLEVGFQQELTKEKMESLASIQDQITRLNLGNTGLQDDWIGIISSFKNLTRLRLENNEITDIGLTHLSALENLASLNLYGTNVTDEGLTNLEHLKKLKKLYLWQTKVTKAGITKLTNKLPDLKIEAGFELATKNEK